MAPSAPPAPMIVWISSINNNILPEPVTSLSARLILSSNSPRYFEPATMPDRSSVKTRFPWMISGISPSAIFNAKPSTMAVLPTPGSPIRHGLFFVRRLNICTKRSISRSLPMTGSSFPLRAYSVRSLLYWSNTGVVDLLLFILCIRNSFFAVFISCPAAINESIYNFCRLIPTVPSKRTAIHSVSFNSAISKCSVPASSVPKCSASCTLCSITLRTRGVKSPFSLVSTPAADLSISCIISSRLSALTAFSRSTSAATPFVLISANSKCSVPT